MHRLADLEGLHYHDFVASAAAIVEPLDGACATGVGEAVYYSIEATRRVVSTNTNLGIVLLLAPLAAVPAGDDLAEGVERVLAATTVEDARLMYRAIRLAVPGGLGAVPDQDVSEQPTVTLRSAMLLAAGHDLIARQYANGFHEVLGEALPALRQSLQAGRPLETAVAAVFLDLLARHPDSLIARKYGMACAAKYRAERRRWLLRSGPRATLRMHLFAELDAWLRQPSNRFNPGTTADLVTAALYAALREGTINDILLDAL